MQGKKLSLVGILLLGLAGMALAQQKTISFVTDSEKQGGFLLAITQAAFEKEGYQVKVEFEPWARALDSVMKGQAEALLGAAYTDERAGKMFYSKLLAKSEMVFFKLKETNAKYDRLEDLKGFSIGIIQDSAYTPDFDAAAYLKKEAASDFQTNIRKLLAKHVDLFLEKKAVVLYALKTNFPDSADKVDFLPKPLKEFLFYDCFSKAVPGAEQKMSDFNAGLDAIMKDGSYQAIMAKGLHE